MTVQRRSLQVFGDLRRLARQRKPPPAPEVAALIARVLSECSAPVIDERPGSVVIRFAAEAPAGVSLTCLLHHAPATPLTTAEAAVARELCSGRTLAQIAGLRGVSHNTVKSQVRHIFRKFNVATRVELLRLLGP